MMVKRAPRTLRRREGRASSIISVPQAQKVVAHGDAADLSFPCFRATIGNKGVTRQVLVGTFEI